MKKKNRKLIAMLLSFLCFYGCSDTENTKRDLTTNYATFYGLTFPLDWGAIYHDEDHRVLVTEEVIFLDRYTIDGINKVDTVKGIKKVATKERKGNFLLSLYENTIAFNPVSRMGNGVGAAVCIRFASSDLERLVPGKYVFSKNFEPNTFVGYSSVKYDTKRGDSYEENLKGESIPNEFGEGEVTVALEGDVYTIRFDCKTVDGGTVSGEFQGPLKIYSIKSEFQKTVDIVPMTRPTDYSSMGAMYDTMRYVRKDGTLYESMDLNTDAFLVSINATVFSGAVFNSGIPMFERFIPLVDIALVFDKETKGVYFESPLKVRALMYHGKSKFAFPCHTTYALAPPTFTEENYLNLKPEDFEFTTSEERTLIPVTTPVPFFVYVETGTGYKGVIRISKITGEQERPGMNPKTARVWWDIKYSRRSVNQKMR